jgi:C_GCAxxG_C_C family probable redox protein
LAPCIHAARFEGQTLEASIFMSTEDNKLTKADLASQLMASGKANCAQSILVTFSEELGLERTLALKLAIGFGGGMGRTGGTCGAVTAAYMVIGLKQTLSNTLEYKDKMYALIREFSSQFKQVHGSVLCLELLGYDVSKPEELVIVRQKGLFRELCPRFVRSSAAILERSF